MCSYCLKTRFFGFFVFFFWEGQVTVLFLFFLTSLSEYNCFTMVCLFYNKVTQLYIYIYPHISSNIRFLFFFFKSFIHLLFLVVLGLRFCARAFSSCGEWGPLFIAVRGPLTVVASLVAEHRLQMRRLSSCGSRI